MKTLPDGTIVLGTLAAGTRIVRFKDMMIGVHPDHPVKVIDYTGIHDLPFSTPDYPGYPAIQLVEEDDLLP